jgi:hypothetical protein
MCMLIKGKTRNLYDQEATHSLPGYNKLIQDHINHTLNTGVLFHKQMDVSMAEGFFGTSCVILGHLLIHLALLHGQKTTTPALNKH